MNLQSLPNTLTLGRIIAVPLFVALFYWGGPLGDPLAALVFILAAVTDWIDGYLARKLGVTTPLGEFLVPAAGGALAFRHGEHFYNFQGLRQFKEKFEPLWEPRYLASPGGLALPRVLASLATLIGGGARGALAR